MFQYLGPYLDILGIFEPNDKCFRSVSMFSSQIVAWKLRYKPNSKKFYSKNSINPIKLDYIRPVRLEPHPSF